MRFTRPTLVTITAPTCSGKNYLRDILEERLNFKRIVSTTTRPKRDGEIERHDYFFISEERSRELEYQGAFAELVTFRGTRDGVSKKEMETKMHGDWIPCIILEPQGIDIYKRICLENGWDIYKIYINTVESERIRRLKERSEADWRAVLASDASMASKSRSYDNLRATHEDRMASITGDERRWLNCQSWDAIVPGDDAEKAVAMIEAGIKWRNKRVAEPTPYEHA